MSNQNYPLNMFKSVYCFRIRRALEFGLMTKWTNDESAFEKAVGAKQQNMINPNVRTFSHELYSNEFLVDITMQFCSCRMKR